jgi:hypothetical protein
MLENIGVISYNNTSYLNPKINNARRRAIMKEDF